MAGVLENRVRAGHRGVPRYRRRSRAGRRPRPRPHRPRDAVRPRHPLNGDGLGIPDRHRPKTELTMWSTTFQPEVIAVLVVLEVAVWQVRVALPTRGRKRSTAVLGAVNAVLSVAAIGQVVTNLDRLENIAGYAIGVAVGVYVGVLVDA